MKIVKSFIQKMVREALQDELKSVLTDVSYRLKTLSEDGEKVGTHRLNFPGHILDGYLIEDDEPTAGSIAWSDCNIVYKGNTYNISDGNTSDKYLYWVKDQDTGEFQTSNTKPVLGRDDVLVAINEDGKAHIVITTGKFHHGASIVAETIGNDEISSTADISTAKLQGAARDIKNSGLGVVAEADDLDDISEGSTNKHFTSTKDIKLDGIQDGATKTEIQSNKLRINGSAVTLHADDVDQIGGTNATTVRDNAAAGVSAKNITDEIYSNGMLVENKIPDLSISKIDGLDAELAERPTDADLSGTISSVETLEGDRDTLMSRTSKLGSDGTITDVSGIGLGSLATKESITESDISGDIGVAKIDGLGSLATKETITESDISGDIGVAKIDGLGNLATRDTVLESHIGNNAVTSAKINNGAVSESKIANNAVTNDKIGSGEIGANKFNVSQHFIF